jgi:hypothetical protein
VIKHFELVDSEVQSASSSEKLPAGGFICAPDTGNIYFVPDGTNKAIKMANDVMYLTDEDRLDLLAPIGKKLYYCTDTGKIWVYNTDWLCLNPTVHDAYDIEPVILDSTGTVTVTDNRITSKDTGVFVPDYSVADLVSNIKVTCADGSATITGTTKYQIPGTLKIAAYSE